MRRPIGAAFTLEEGPMTSQFTPQSTPQSTRYVSTTRLLAIAAVLAGAVLFPGAAQAQGKIKVGLMLPYTGTYAALYWALVVCDCVLAQMFWLLAVRRSIVAVLLISIFTNIGMWLERICIVLNTLSHHYEPSLWGSFLPTLWDWLL